MTREEAIEILERKTTIPDTNYTWAQIDQAIDTAISALRSVSREQELETENKELKERIVNWRKYMAPTREQVEIWRGEWEMNSNWPDTIICSKCAHRFDVWKHEEKDFHFCPHCGAPMSRGRGDGDGEIGGTEMTDREKMIDLIINAKRTDPETGSFAEYLADFLLGYGVKLPTSHPGKPLTLDRLREMDGQPVWIVEYPDWGHWELSEDANDYIVDRNLDFYGMKHDDPDGRYGLHKLGWLAYSYPPAQQRWIKEANMPPTNGDHIRAMDDKELSDWICSIMTSECCDRTCPGREFCELGHKGLLDWLQATYKEEI